MGAIGDLIRTAAEFIPPWALALIAAVVFIASLPGLRTGLRVKRVRALLRKVTRADGETRLQLLEEAWKEAEGHPEALLALAREADKFNQPSLRDRATKALQKIGGYELSLRKLNAKPPAQDRAIKHPVEASVIIETMLSNGAVEAAKKRFREARKAFPHHDGWADLQRKIDEFTPPQRASPSEDSSSSTTPGS